MCLQSHVLTSTRARLPMCPPLARPAPRSSVLLQPYYSYRSSPGGVRVTVHLPVNCPLVSVQGPERTTKDGARQVRASGGRSGCAGPHARRPGARLAAPWPNVSTLTRPLLPRSPPLSAPQSACLAALRQLHGLGALNDFLEPAYTRRGRMRQAQQEDTREAGGGERGAGAGARELLGARSLLQRHAPCACLAHSLLR